MSAVKMKVYRKDRLYAADKDKTDLIYYNNKESDLKTIEAIKLNLKGIKNLSKERILNEL